MIQKFFSRPNPNFGQTAPVSAEPAPVPGKPRPFPDGRGFLARSGHDGTIGLFVPLQLPDRAGVCALQSPLARRLKFENH
jgi:hypothetical protein